MFAAFGGCLSFVSYPGGQGIFAGNMTLYMKQVKQRTAEYRISNRRMSKGGIASLGLFKNNRSTQK
jgi:hypothetical protein